MDSVILHFTHLIRHLGSSVKVADVTRRSCRDTSTRGAGTGSTRTYSAAAAGQGRGQDAAEEPQAAAGRGRRQGPPAPVGGDHPQGVDHPPGGLELGRDRNTGWNPRSPGAKLAFAKTDEALPYMTWDEAERRVAAGADPDKVWECLYLRPAEVTEFLAWVKDRPVSPWVYPMFCFAAYTGARRSEIVRARPEDLDLAGRGRDPPGEEAGPEAEHDPAGPAYAGPQRRPRRIGSAGGRAGDVVLQGTGAAVTPREAQNYFRRAVRVSKWKVRTGLARVPPLVHLGAGQLRDGPAGDRRVRRALDGRAAAAVPAHLPGRQGEGHRRCVRLSVTTSLVPTQGDGPRHDRSF